MTKTVYTSDSRGFADHGWLRTRYSFSFANYYNPDRIHFGELRVINDDIVAGGRGFGTHPHDNMEIITIPLSGDLAHKDSMGNSSVIREGDIQVMSAGTGITHSEFNHNPDREVRLLQIWVFPDKKNVTPRYDQKSLKDLARDNALYEVLSPDPEGPGVWIHQQAWFSMGTLSSGWKDTYTLHKENNGVYVLVLEGEMKVAGEKLSRRDAVAVSDVNALELEATTDARVLLMEVPMMEAK